MAACSFVVTGTWHADPRTAGTGRTFVVRTTVPRRRGKPPFSALRLRDKIVAHVLHLQRTDPRKLESIIEEVLTFHNVSRATVFNALAAHDPEKPVDAGSCTFVVTHRFRITWTRIR